MKKSIAALLALTLTATTAFSFAAVAEESADLVWWGWTPGSPVNEEFIAEFNKEYPDINITWKQGITMIRAIIDAVRPKQTAA